MGWLPGIPADDLRYILAAADRDLRSLRGARLFLTGCTGFLGKWLIEALLGADRELGLDLRLTALTRRARRLWTEMPAWPADKRLRLLEKDVTRLDPVDTGPVTHVVHGANLANDHRPGWPLDHLTVGLDGTRRVLALATAHDCRALLLLSSGGVYGLAPGGDGPPFVARERGPDDYLNEPLVYATVKYAEELLTAAHGREHGQRIPVARCFTFAGAHMPLAERSAVGSFFHDASRGRDIVIRGDGTARRGYQYAADMAVWLIGLLCRGRHATAYNVGSDAAVSVRELAAAVAAAGGGRSRVTVLGEPTRGNAPPDYVPETASTRTELGFADGLDLATGLARTWASWQRDNDD